MAEMHALPDAEEYYGDRSFVQRYACDRRNVRRIRSSRGRGRGGGLRTRAQKFFKEAFLPQGYPDSVSDDYLAYQLWDTLQAFCSSITGTLATMAILKGVGVGDSTATPLAATITWMLKDGAGMLGRILFAWIQGTDLDCNAKKWRYMADIMNDIGTFLELLAPLFPHVFLLVVCAASISKSIVGIAGGATRAAIVQHQARRDNMADVAAKDSSQETLVNFVALLVNFVLTPAVAGKIELIWCLFALFTILHLYANYRAVSVVKMETLNKKRLHILMTDYLATGVMPNPTSVNDREPILMGTDARFSYKLGVPLAQVLTSASDYESAVQNHNAGRRIHMKASMTQRKVHVALHSDCTVSDQLEAACTVEVLDFITQNKTPIRGLEELRSRTAIAKSPLETIQSFVHDNMATLLASLNESGWVINHHLLGVDEWRYSWQEGGAYS